MERWSREFQSADFLEASRMMIMNRDMAHLAAGWLGLAPGASALDVGCGAGDFAFYLADAVPGARFTGVDLEASFIERARERAAKRPDAASFSFMRGDATALPFADGAFDLVVSHTVLTSIPDYRGALREMARVCRPGAQVASVTAMTFFNQTQCLGVYPAKCEWLEPYRALSAKARAMYQAQTPIEDFIRGVDPIWVPRAFVEAGFRRVRAYPIGKFFSLSNAALSDDDKRKYIELDYRAERAKFAAHWGMAGARDYMTDGEAERYVQLLETRRDALLSDIGENEVWEWLGDANLLVIGTTPKECESV